MQSHDMQVIGICRFSYPGIGGFQVEHDTIEARIRFLYDPERLEERFATFEAITLPALRAQTDPNFIFVVVIGDQLPAPYRTRLETLLADIPQARLDPRPPGPHRQVMRDAINAALADTQTPSLQFRMDDDDAVSVDYVETLRAAAQDQRAMIRKNRHIAIDFIDGHVLRTDGPLQICHVQEQFWTPALAISAKPRIKNTIMNFSHTKLWKMMPSLALTTPHMFIRGHNTFNDSRMKPNPSRPPLAPLTYEDAVMLETRHNIDVDRLAALLGGG